MRRLIFLLPLLFLFSCQQQKNVSRSADYYSSLFLPYTDVKVKQKLFIDSSSMALAKVFADSSVVINTANLRLLLDTLEQACQAGQSILYTIQEMDTSLRYKSKVLEYIAFSHMASKGEFKEMLNILDTKSVNRYDSIVAFFTPTIEDLKRRSDECYKTSDAFRTKYQIGEKK